MRDYKAWAFNSLENQMCKCTAVYINFYGMLRVALGIIQYYIYDSLFTAFIVEFIRFSNYSIYIRWHLPTEQHVVLLTCNEVVMYSFCLFPRKRQPRLRSWSLMNSWSFIKFFEVFRNLPKFFEVSYKIGSHMKSYEVWWTLMKSFEVSWNHTKSGKVCWSFSSPMNSA
jgi:hypothetical protein